MNKPKRIVLEYTKKESPKLSFHELAMKDACADGLKWLARTTCDESLSKMTIYEFVDFLKHKERESYAIWIKEQYSEYFKESEGHYEEILLCRATFDPIKSIISFPFKENPYYSRSVHKLQEISTGRDYYWCFVDLQCSGNNPGNNHGVHPELIDALRFEIERNRMVLIFDCFIDFIHWHYPRSSKDALDTLRYHHNHNNDAIDALRYAMQRGGNVDG
jgi:hypothetical protein